MKKYILLVMTLLCLTLAVPQAQVIAQAPKLDYSGFVKCDGVVKTGDPAEAERNRVCDFAALVDTVIKAVNFLFYLSIAVAPVLFAYAGYLFMTGKPGNITTARKISLSVAVGFIIMLSAWFVVRQVIDWFVDDPAATTFLR